MNHTEETINCGTSCDVRVRAEARIEGDTVLVSSVEVPNPVAVRYAWADSPECNFFNKNGLPASPFLTDGWPGISPEH